MKLIPQQTLILEIPDPLPIVRQRLLNQLEPPKMFRFSPNHRPYTGTVTEDGFQITRIIHYRNSALPVIRGRFESVSRGTIVHITLRSHPVVIGFLVFWFLNWFGILIPIIFAGGVPLEFAIPAVVLPLAFLAILWAGFWYEVDRSRRDLTQIFQGLPLESK